MDFFGGNGGSCSGSGNALKTMAAQVSKATTSSQRQGQQHAQQTQRGGQGDAMVAEFLQGPSASNGNRTTRIGNSFGRLRLVEDLPPPPSLMAPSEQQINWSLSEFNGHAMHPPSSQYPALAFRRQEEHAAFEAAFGRASSSSSSFSPAEVPPRILGTQVASIPAWSSGFHERSSHGRTLASGQEAASSWEAEFQTALEVDSQRANASLASTAAMKQADEEDEEVGLEEQFQDFLKHAQEVGDPSWMDGFNAAWKNTLPRTADMQEGSTEWESSDWAAELERADAAAKANNTTNADPDPVTAPLLEYIFEAVNPYLSHPNPLQEGIDILARHGALSDAALAFEAACQRRASSDAWMLLGRTQAEDEKEGPAIAALQRSVKENPENAPALMALAVGYTNEGMDLNAYTTLQRWLHATYPSLAGPTSSLSGNNLLESLTNGFMEAARRGPGASISPLSGSIDPDVQIGLGVLFYNDAEYSKAVDCFASALSVRPGDYRLWSRLGATLANSGRSEEAIDAYHKALEINPTFVRGRYNLGVSCINIGCYKEAVEHFLGALSLHRPGEQANISKNLWDTLRRTFILMERRDLSSMTEAMDLSVFKKEFDF